MRVLFNLLDAGIGGGQRVAIDVARRLSAGGDPVGVLVPEPGPASDAFEDLGGRVHVADLQSLRRPAGVRRASALARGYDLLYSHTSTPGEILGEAAARGARRPHVIHRHLAPFFSPSAPVARGQRALYRAAMRRPWFIAVGPHVRRALRAEGVPAQRITVIANGVDGAEVRRRSSSPIGTGRRVGMLARLAPDKGPDVFLDAVPLVRSAEVTFAIGGVHGPFVAFEDEVRAAAARLAVPIVDVGDRGVEYLAGLEIVTIPSTSEGSPLVLLEAMALGKPIVASAIPGIDEVLAPTGAGLLVPPGDPRALAAAIAELLGDPDRAAELGRRAAAASADHELVDVLEAIVLVLRRAARSGG